jgi:hypothetical protein
MGRAVSSAVRAERQIQTVWAGRQVARTLERKVPPSGKAIKERNDGTCWIEAAHKHPPDIPSSLLY